MTECPHKETSQNMLALILKVVAAKYYELGRLT